MKVSAEQRKLNNEQWDRQLSDDWFNWLFQIESDHCDHSYDVEEFANTESAQSYFHCKKCGHTDHHVWY